ncbi:TVP38/TMEM64 family protein [Jeotgalibacillus terrae]|uniref:TVP38/TMEM64 family membrane protein n=1 Tax=Jeotgalibacillus terrae TaxID=587735 RepID=A0ABW5ZHK9_9BACL|nr:TVP38/TMEM64 family protein [Jeotgalibacillus terrae]MBM7578774.1 putative membrane protein YdjX (TVP38/TMEM64 family) [Jeotgalibacillus terrae]
MKKWGGWILIAAIVAGLIVLNQTVLDLSPDRIRGWILSVGILAPVLYVVLYTVRPFILFPASVLSLAGGLAFGPLYGTLLTMAGATAGAILAFMFAKKAGAKRVEEKLGKRGEKLQDQLEHNGFFIVLLLRLVPLFNFDLISYAAGASKVRLLPFALATLIGIIPGTFAYTFLGFSTGSDSTQTIIIAVTIFAVIFIVPMLFRDKIKSYLQGRTNGSE